MRKFLKHTVGKAIMLSFLLALSLFVYQSWFQIILLLILVVFFYYGNKYWDYLIEKAEKNAEEKFQYYRNKNIADSIDRIRNEL